MADNVVAGLLMPSLCKLVTALWRLSVVMAMTSSSARHFEAPSYLQGPRTHRLSLMFMRSTAVSVR